MATGGQSSPELAKFKAEQKSVRTKITTAEKAARGVMAQNGSRHSLREIVARIKVLGTQAEDINRSIEPLLTDQTKVSSQYRSYLDYVTKITELEHDVETHLEDRKGEASSTASVRQKYAPSELLQQAARRSQQLLDAKKVAEEAQKQAAAATAAFQQQQQQMDAARQLQEAARIAADQAAQALRDLAVDDDDDTEDTAPTVIDNRVRDWIATTTNAAAPPGVLEDEAPDEWIDRYVSGQELPLDPTVQSSGSSVSPEPFTGRPLDWFAWAEMFYATVHHTRRSVAEKLVCLKASLKKTHGHLVIGAGELAYKDGLRRLKEECGKRSVIRAALAQELKTIHVPRDPPGFKRAALEIRTYLFELSRIGELSNTDYIDHICQRMGQNDLLAWNSERGSGLERRTLIQFGDWLCKRADAYQCTFGMAAIPSGGAVRSHPGGGGGHQSKPHHHGRSNKASSGGGGGAAATPSTASSGPGGPKHRPPFCFKCEGAHRLEECPDYKKETVEDRKTFCIRRSLCFMCLFPKHDSRNCHKKKPCGIDGCTLHHHPLLHLTTSSTSASVHSDAPGRVALGVVQLDALSSTGRRVEANLFYDEGSDSTLFRDGLIRSLALKGLDQVLQIDGVGGKRTTYPHSRRVKLKVVTNTGEEIIIQGSTALKVTNPVPFVDWSNIKKRWKHLEDLPLRSGGGRIDILLGLDYAHLAAALESRIGLPFEPVAARTRLGWVARGVIGADVPASTVRVNLAMASPFEVVGPELAAALKQFCEMGEFGAEYPKEHTTPANKRAMEMVDAGTKKLVIGYEAPIVWLHGEPTLSSNKAMVENRNRSLLLRFRKDPDYERRYRAAMEVNFRDGYAVRLSKEQLAANPPAYYLPHFGVPKFPGSKDIRVVFDAAAKYGGRCLNGSICSGPALQNPLPAVLIRFREGEYAWAADIKAMFSRIRLQPKDRSYHHFIYTEPDGSTSECQMTRFTFGVNCSPFVAIRTTWRAAEEAKPEFKCVEETIKRNIYVDDYLDSAPEEEEGIRRARMVRTVLADGDFHLQEFTSNSAKIVAALNSVGGGATGSDTDLNIGDGAAEKVLGVFWQPKSDTLGFRVAEADAISFTRLGLTSKLASVFDPLGTAAPMVVKGRIKLRELILRGAGWHDPVVGDELLWWKNWFDTLSQLKHMEMPRCLFPRASQIARRELHTFTDASEEAFCASVYVRAVYQDGTVLVRQVKALSRLSQTKTLSINKLELNAALLGSRLARFVQSSLQSKFDARYFWTDSSTVRNWVRATSAYYQVYVSNRIGEIQMLTEPEEWRFVPGRLNPADIGTRSALEAEALPYTWIYGPEFLNRDPTSWPEDLPWIAVTEELRSARVHHVAASPAFDWESVIITADCIPTLVKLEGAHLDLLKRAQQEAYGEEMDRLRRGKALKPNSNLLQFTPALGSDGLLRLGGRIGNAPLPYDSLHPPLLPGHHPLAKKIIQAFHERLHHVGTEYVVTHIRQHLWLTGGREAVKRVQRSCPRCIRERAKPSVQLMADLPVCRLDAGTPPFSQSACDFFGPVEIGLPRNRTAKRWGALFTCLVTRAVYLDLAASLSSDDFLLLLRRFIALYGKPKRMYSDNGTNFVGAERELREAVEALHQSEQLHQLARMEAIEWHFQPARTPHFGGAHESLVRSTKRAMYAALDAEKGVHRYPTEDTLRTILFEIAGLLNARPLTCSSPDPADVRPLTPNDFLNRPPAADLPAGEFRYALPNEHYRYTQRMINLFWEQWKGPYLQSLVSRRKWTTPTRNLAEGDYVMEAEEGVRRGQWRTGRVSRVHPGQDKLVRAVTVKFPSGELRRGIRHLCLLEKSSSGPTEASSPDSGEHGAATEV